jgi:hypothetical protein
MTLNEIYPEIQRVFTEVFGRTPLRQRIEDIQGEASELDRFLDISHLKEETGQLLASTLMLCHEAGWNPAHLIHDALNTIWDRVEQYKSMGQACHRQTSGAMPFGYCTLRAAEGNVVDLLGALLHD